MQYRIAIRSPLMGIVLSGLFVATAAAQVTVTGDARIYVRPDQVELTLGVETRNKNLEVAKKKHDAETRAVIAAVQSLGVPDSKISTDYIEIEPLYDAVHKPSQFIEYVVRQTVVVTLEDIDKFETLLTDALNAGANYVLDVKFRTTELRKHRDKARQLAIVAAKEKADALAAALGQRIGAATQINEQANQWWDFYGSRWGRRWNAYASQNTVVYAGEGGSDDGGAFMPGEIGVSASVSVTFALEPEEGDARTQTGEGPQ